MDRVSLYYPTIEIADIKWLKAALLYSDKVSSIFPFVDMTVPEVPRIVRELHDLGQYKPLMAYKILEAESQEPTTDFKEFESTVLSIFDSDEFTNLTKNAQNVEDESIIGLFRNKLTKPIYQKLLEKDLVGYPVTDVVAVNKVAYHVYMALLARFLSRVSDDSVTPSSGDPYYENVSLFLGAKGVSVSRLIFDKCLPVPSEDISLGEIVEFKTQRMDELLRFRGVVDEVESKIRNAVNREQLKEVMIAFTERMVVELRELNKLLKDSKIKFILSGFSSLIDNETDLIGPVGAGLGSATLFNEPLIGLGVGALSLALQTSSSLVKIRRNASSSSMSYLYFAREAGIIPKR